MKVCIEIRHTLILIIFIVKFLRINEFVSSSSSLSFPPRKNIHLKGIFDLFILNLIVGLLTSSLFESKDPITINFSSWSDWHILAVKLTLTGTVGSMTSLPVIKEQDRVTLASIQFQFRDMLMINFFIIIKLKENLLQCNLISNLFLYCNLISLRNQQSLFLTKMYG